MTSISRFHQNLKTFSILGGIGLINSIRLGGKKLIPLRQGKSPYLPCPTKADYASLSPSDAALLDSPTNTPVALILSFKEKKNPFSPEQYPEPDEEMYPDLPSPQVKHVNIEARQRSHDVKAASQRPRATQGSCAPGHHLHTRFRIFTHCAMSKQIMYGQLLISRNQ